MARPFHARRLQALDELSQAQASLTARSKELEEIESQLVAAEAVVERAEHRADVRRVAVCPVELISVAPLPSAVAAARYHAVSLSKRGVFTLN